MDLSLCELVWHYGRCCAWMLLVGSLWMISLFVPGIFMDEIGSSHVQPELIPQPSTLHSGQDGTEDEGPAPGADVRFWKPYTLTFHDEALEKWFSRDRLASWLENDPVAHHLSVVPVLLTLTVTWNALSTGLKCALTATAATAPLLSHWSSQPSYGPNRSIVIAVTRTWSAFLAANVSLSGICSMKSYSSLLGRLIIWGPLAPLLVSSVNMRIPFRVQLPVQLVAVVLSSLWLQHICTHANQFYSLFGSIGENVDTIMAKMYVPFLYDTQGSIKMPCHVVIVFSHFVFGLVVPCLLVFIFEVYARAEFCMKVGYVDSLCRTNNIQDTMNVKW